MASTVKKITVALGQEEYAWAKRRAKSEHTSVSAVLTAAARRAREEEEKRARQDAAWSEFVDWATDGAGISEEELEAARRELEDEA